MKIFYYREVNSTMDIAQNLAERGVPEGSIVLADIQKEGRGRKGRKWYSPEGGLWFTIILYPKLKKEDLNFLPILMGVSIIQGLEPFLSISLNLKWPNDIEFKGKKVGGILIESKWEGHVLKYVNVGIGINLMIPPENFDNKDFKATSLLKYLKEKNKFLILEKLYEKIMENYKNFPQNKKDIYEYFLKKFPYIGKEVLLYSESSQKIVKIIDISKDGSLLVEEDGEIKNYNWGVISVRT
ncbi:MAG: biotin--[acetyl-CoA-carboxylase] ligase [Dictyoglomus sp.]|nr:biotin--[acetyl-CoA-carboxylase] ligase [Dictyoglomus sp.]MCX7942218.1 biotin--[acetyl-CoA-carboxylase] ligase [Dictyoglomaceae bacterium]MDW8188681.1 biotin--[acetyl-CoA-carboxylase] ligase [Dictyoglomus sp.]